MIKGIGSDLIEISRVREAVERNQRFLTRYFSVKEQAYFETRKGNPETIAANFAIKEAVSKAFGTGFRGIQPQEIQGLRDELGKPYVVLTGKAEDMRKSLGITSIHVSVSHNKDNAMAFVVCEGDE